MTEPFSQQLEQASVSVYGLLNITPTVAEEKLLKSRIVAAHVVFDVVPQRPFYILVLNFKNLPTRPLRGGKLADASGPPEYIIYTVISNLRKNSDTSAT